MPTVRKRKLDLDDIDSLPVSIRNMNRADVPAVLDIELQSFCPSYVEEDFNSFLLNKGVTCLVAEHQQRIVGYIIYRDYFKRTEILSLAVADRFRRKDIGAQLMQHVQDSRSSYCRGMTALIRDDNLPAHLFFKACGWLATKVLRNEFELADGSKLDAYRFVKKLGDRYDDSDE